MATKKPLPVKKKKGNASDQQTDPALTQDLPRSAKEIISILNDMNVMKFDFRVTAQLLEFSHSMFSTYINEHCYFCVFLRFLNHFPFCRVCHCREFETHPGAHTIGYVHDVLEDAQRFAEHRTSIDNYTLNKDDVRLAVTSRLDCSFAAPPPREVNAIFCCCCCKL